MMNDETPIACETPDLSWEGAAWTVEELERLCGRYHGTKGIFSYRAFAWCDQQVFGGLPIPLLQWALTAYGGCLGQAQIRPAHDVPVITMHPAVWIRNGNSVDDGRGWAETIIPGPRQTLDLLLHELVHVEVSYRGAGGRGTAATTTPHGAPRSSGRQTG